MTCTSKAVTTTALILAQTGRDADILQRILGEAEVPSHICADLAEISKLIGDSALFVIIAEEGLSTSNVRPLAHKIQDQSPWSDIPFIVLTRSGGGIDRNPAASRIVASLGNVSFLERPFHATTLVSLARSAIRARRRQFAMRDNLQALKQSKEVARESATRFRMLADNIAQFAWIADHAGEISWYNQRWFNYTGTTYKEMQGWGWTRCHHPDHVGRVVDSFQKSLKSGAPWEDTFPLRSAHGDFRWFLSRALPIRGEDGNIIHWFGTNTDITDVRLTEERLRDSEATFRAMFANSSLGKIQIDAETGRFVRANEAMCRIVGFRENELQMLRESDLNYPADNAAENEQLQRLFTGETSEYDVEKRYIRKDGSVVWVQVTLNAIRNDAGRLVRMSGVVQDITSRKQIGEQLRLLMREVNHRSKNLLAVVQSVARQTARDTSPREFIRSFSERLQGLSASQDLLVAGDWISVDLETLIRSQLKFLGESRDRRIKINGPKIVITPNVAQAIGLAIHELATNALKYGSLSVKTGEVHIDWLIDAQSQFTMTWSESGGPQVREPERLGFGRVVIERMVATSLNGKVDLRYLPAGVVWTMAAELSNITSAGASAD